MTMLWLFTMGKLTEEGLQYMYISQGLSCQHQMQYTLGYSVLLYGRYCCMGALWVLRDNAAIVQFSPLVCLFSVQNWM